MNSVENKQKINNIIIVSLDNNNKHYMLLLRLIRKNKKERIYSYFQQWEVEYQVRDPKHNKIISNRYYKQFLFK